MSWATYVFQQRPQLTTGTMQPADKEDRAECRLDAKYTIFDSRSVCTDKNQQR